MAKIVNPYIQFYTSVDHTFVQEQCQWYYPVNGVTYWNNPEPGHIWKWAAKKPGDEKSRFPLDFQQFSDNKRPYGKNWRIVPSYGPDNKSPLDAYSLRYFHPFSWDYHVIPIVQVSADFHYDNEGVRLACENFLHNVSAVSDWYASQLGKGFTVCRPQVVPDYRNTAQIWNLYQASKTDDQSSPARHLPWETAHKDYSAHMRGRVNTNLIYAFTHYAGPNAAWDFAASGGGAYLFVSSFATIERAQDNPTLFYATAHEIGHCFGLGHTEHTLAANWQQSVMQAARPPQAILCEYEKARLLNNPFFK